MSSDLVSRLTARVDLNYGQARQLCESLLDGAYSDEQAANALVLLAEKGETPEELRGFVETLLSHSLTLPYAGDTFDTCGTGGSGLVRFNVSTAVAFILATSGVVVAKHGNRGSRRPNGSFDLLEALGIPVELEPAAVTRCLEQTGLGFLYAPQFHPMLGRMAKARAIASRRTLFNLAGPLSNPTRVTAQVVGTPSVRDAGLVSRCLQRLGREGVAIVGHSGLDDVDLSGPALLVPFRSPSLSVTLDPSSLGLPHTPVAEVPGGNAATNAELFLLLLDDQAPKPLRQVVCLSAAVALVAAGKALTHEDGYVLATELLSSGRTKAKFFGYKRCAAG